MSSSSDATVVQYDIFSSSEYQDAVEDLKNTLPKNMLVNNDHESQTDELDVLEAAVQYIEYLEAVLQVNGKLKDVKNAVEKDEKVWKSLL